MQLSDAAYLKSYEVDFLSSDFKQFDENPMQAVIWRDSDFNILQQCLSELDFLAIKLYTRTTFRL